LVNLNIINGQVISDDGAKLYAQTKKVYLFQKHDIVYHFDNPSIYGQIETGMVSILGFDDCPVINSFFITTFSNYSPSGYQGVIEQYNTTSLNLIRSYTVSSVSTDGGPTKYLTDARYIFVNTDAIITIIPITKARNNDPGLGWNMSIPLFGIVVLMIQFDILLMQFFELKVQKMTLVVLIEEPDIQN